MPRIRSWMDTLPELPMTKAADLRLESHLRALRWAEAVTETPARVFIFAKTKLPLQSLGSLFARVLVSLDRQLDRRAKPCQVFFCKR